MRPIEKIANEARLALAKRASKNEGEEEARPVPNPLRYAAGAGLGLIGRSILMSPRVLIPAGILARGVLRGGAKAVVNQAERSGEQSRLLYPEYKNPAPWPPPNRISEDVAERFRQNRGGS